VICTDEDGFLGEQRVNVMQLNAALNRGFPMSCGQLPRTNLHS
jgi:hypothetical protein